MYQHYRRALSITETISAKSAVRPIAHYHDTVAALRVPLTYFMDRRGYILYAHRRHVHGGVPGCVATLVYYPSLTGERLHTTYGWRYAKFVTDGLPYELPFVRQLPTPVQRRIFELSVHDERTGEDFLFVPDDEIWEVYDAKQALGAVCADTFRGISGASRQKIAEVIALLAGTGISEKRLGLYGGLQSLLVKPDADGPQLDDIDILVSGVEQYATIRALASHNVPDESRFTPIVASDPIKRAVVRRRWEVSQFTTPRYHTICDVRIVRSPIAYNPFPLDDNQEVRGTEVDLRATVVVAEGSLSLPVHYGIRLADGREFDVWSRYYHSIAAATVGDVVRVRGLLVRGSTMIFLRDSVRHCIYRLPMGLK